MIQNLKSLKNPKKLAHPTVQVLKKEISFVTFYITCQTRTAPKYFLFFVSIKVCASKSVYFQRIKAIVKVYRFACAHFSTISVVLRGCRP